MNRPSLISHEIPKTRYISFLTLQPEDDIEMKRIKAAGGHVNTQGRVNGGLNLSRAIGLASEYMIQL